MTTSAEELLRIWKKEWADGVLLALSDNEKNSAERIFVEMLESENTIRKNCSSEYWNIWPSEGMITLLAQYEIRESVAVSAVHYYNKYKDLLLGLSTEQIKEVASNNPELYSILQNAFGLNT